MAPATTATIQEAPSSSSSSNKPSTSRILLSLPLLRSLKLQTGEPVAVSLGTTAHAVGTVWPSFSLDHDGVQLPSALQPGFAAGDKVHVTSLVGTPSAQTLLLQPVTPTTVQAEMLALFAKQALLERECVYVGQELHFTFQGEQVQLTIQSTEPEPVAPSHAALSLSPVLVTRSTHVRIAQPKQDSASVKATSDTEDAYAKLGGLDQQIREIRTLVEMPLTRPDIFRAYGLRPPRGVLLFGPPGTGKTSLARAVAAATGSAYLTINGPELSSAFHGETEGKLREVFAEARRRSPCVVIIDEIDALAPRRDPAPGTADGAGEVERRVVAQLLTLLDGMDTDDPDARIVILAATNRPNALDPALRRPGRLDREIEIGIPTVDARRDILTTLLRRVPHSVTEEDLDDLARRTHGYVGADLAALVREGGLKAVRRAFDASLADRLAALSLDAATSPVSAADIQSALPLVRPSAMREIALDAPKVFWSDIAGSDTTARAVRELVEWPLTHADSFVRLGVTPPRGVLLYGPPGCSKTLIARALATESGLNFIPVKGPELFSKYLGESERALRDVFRKARAAAPSIIFFDEIDALTTTRSQTADSGPADRVIATLLNELDGIEGLANVVTVAATNRPNVIDPALLRPGRLDRLVYIPPPTSEARRQILTNQSRKMALADDVDLDAISTLTEGCSGAEVVSVAQEAGLLAMNEDINTPSIAQRHLEQAAKSIKRRISPALIRSYEEWRDSLSI